MWQARHPLQLVIGPLIWCLWFVLLYAGLSLYCQYALPGAEGPGGLNLVLLSLTLLTLILLLGLGWRCWRARPSEQAPSSSGRDEGLICLVATLSYLLSAGAALFVALPLLFLPPCL